MPSSASRSISYKPGDLIWAKMRGHPAWPARVSSIFLIKLSVEVASANREERFYILFNFPASSTIPRIMLAETINSEPPCIYLDMSLYIIGPVQISNFCRVSTIASGEVNTILFIITVSAFRSIPFEDSILSMLILFTS